MIISLGSSPKVIESINRKFNFIRDTYFFDRVLCNFETVLYFLKYIDHQIIASDLYDTEQINNENGMKTINHTNLRLSFINDFPASNSFATYNPVFLELINRRLRKFKKAIVDNYHIDFIHCLDEQDNYKFNYCSSYRNTNLFIPTNQMVNDAVTYIKKINPKLQFNIHFIINPIYGESNKDILETLSNPHLKIHYVTCDKGNHVITGGHLCIDWNWNEIYNSIKNDSTIELPYDFNPIFYKKIYPDMANFTDEEVGKHYLEHGIKEERIYKIDEDIQFNPTIYKRIYEDLRHLSDEEARLHYLCNGIKENRKYRYEDIFNAETYKKLNSDLQFMTDREATQHFYQYGINENRNIF